MIVVSGCKLLAFLRQHSPADISMKALKRAIDTGRCSVNGKIERFSTRILKKGDRVEIDYEPSAAPTVLYEDEDLLICDKPSGFVSENRPFQNCFGNPHLELVHRLDKDTTGVIILAKTPRMRLAMEDLFKLRKVKKQYLAIVSGLVRETSGTIETFLAKKEGSATWGSVAHRGGKKAVTIWTCLKKGKGASLLALVPLTGRTHQLRVHLAEWGHPILGDHVYFKGQHPFQPRRHLLHAESVTFIHPFTEQSVTVTAPIPPDFASAQTKLCL